MLDLWKKQLKSANFSLTYDNPNVFTLSQWQRNSAPSIFYLIYRICMTVFFICSLILSIVDEPNLDKPFMFRLKWVIYLTNWGLSFATVQSIIGAAILIKRFYNKDEENNEEENNTCGLYKFYWLTNIIGTDASFAITTLYWIVIYDAATMPLDYLNILVHAMNSISMLLELLVVAHPVKLTHGYLSFSFGGVYTIFSAVYHLCGGTSRDGLPYIYKVIDWKKPIPTLLICVGAMFFMIVIHCTTYFIYRARVCVAHKLMKTDEDTQIPINDILKGEENDIISKESA